MKRLTLAVDARTAAWARAQATRRKMSLSRFIGELLRDQMPGSREYVRAMKRYLSKAPTPLSQPGEAYPTREELHARRALGAT